MRLIVVGVIYNHDGEVLLCKMPPGRGVFPGQWGLPGGGIEAGELAEDALHRELLEEVSLPVTDLRPLFFSEGVYTKTFPDRGQQEFYMVFLIYACRAVNTKVHLNAEFESYAWVMPDDLKDYDLNVETRKTFQRMKVLG
jgi:nucleoside triphosphatase